MDDSKNFNIRIWIHNQSELFEIANKIDKFGLKEALWKPWWEVTLQAQDLLIKGMLAGADENLKKLDASYSWWQCKNGAVTGKWFGSSVKQSLELN